MTRRFYTQLKKTLTLTRTFPECFLHLLEWDTMDTNSYCYYLLFFQIMEQLVQSIILKAVHTVWCQVLEEKSCWLLPVCHPVAVGVRFVGRCSRIPAPRRPTRRPSTTTSPTSAPVARSTSTVVVSENTDRVVPRPWAQILSSSIIISCEASNLSDVSCCGFS